MSEKAPMTKEQIETQIRMQMGVIRRKRLAPEKIAAEFRKYDGIYRAAVVEGSSTVGAYIYREAYRRVLDGNKSG